MTPAANTAIPSVDQLADELALIVGEGFASSLTSHLAGLLGLRYVQQKAGSDDSVACLAVLPDALQDAVHRLGESTDAAVATALLGFGRTRGQLAKTRRHAAGQLLGGIAAESFRRRHERRHLASVATAVYATEHTFQLRHAHRLGEATEAAQSGLAIDWVAWHRAYGRVWTSVWALAADLEVLLRRRREAPTDPKLADYQRSSLWWFARFLREKERFTHECGGLWLLADLDAEMRVADAVYRISWHRPFNQEGDSWLRLTLDAIPGGELIAFVELLKRSPEGQRLLSLWVDWIGACRCSVKAPDDGCEVHQVIAQCRIFTDEVDRDWTKIADWYRDPEVRDLRGIQAVDLHDQFRVKRKGSDGEKHGTQS